MLRGTDLGLQISAGHHLQAGKTEHVSPLSWSRKLSLATWAEKQEPVLPSQRNKLPRTQSRLPLATPAKPRANRGNSSHSRFWKGLGRTHVARERACKIPYKRL